MSIWIQADHTRRVRRVPAPPPPPRGRAIGMRWSSDASRTPVSRGALRRRFPGRRGVRRDALAARGRQSNRTAELGIAVASSSSPSPSPTPSAPKSAEPTPTDTPPPTASPEPTITVSPKPVVGACQASAARCPCHALGRRGRSSDRARRSAIRVQRCQPAGAGSPGARREPRQGPHQGQRDPFDGVDARARGDCPGPWRTPTTTAAQPRRRR